VDGGREYVKKLKRLSSFYFVGSKDSSLPHPSLSKKWQLLQIIILFAVNTDYL
jgi:hypothetical protein